MRGRRHCYHRTGSVAEAIVAHRPSQQTTCSRVPTTRSCASFDRRTRTSPAYPLTNSSTQSRCGDSASNIVVIAFRRVSGCSSSSLGSTVSGISAAANPYGLRNFTCAAWRPSPGRCPAPANVGTECPGGLGRPRQLSRSSSAAWSVVVTDGIAVCRDTRVLRCAY